MPRLRITERDPANLHPGRLKDTAADADVRLGLDQTAGLEIYPRFVAQSRNRHGKRPGRELIRDPVGENLDRRQTIRRVFAPCGQ